MDSFLYWYSQNNKLIIQVLAVLIGLVLISLVYRLFFSSPDASEDSDEHKSVNQLQDLDKKMTDVMSALGNLKPNFVSEEGSTEALPPAREISETSAQTENAAVDTTESTVNPVENEILKKEIDAAKAALKAKDKEISEVKEQLATQKKIIEKNSKGTTRMMIDTTALEGDKDLIAKIDELQKKLSEYDIIAEDISELQNLRKEVSELKEKLGVSAAATPPAAPEET